MGIFSRATPEKRFWDWFQKNEPRLFNLEPDQEAIFDELGERLAEYHEDIAFEMTPITDGRREFVVSADGMRELIEPVRVLVDAAPALGRWQIVAFRPRMGEYRHVQLEFAGRTFDAEDIWVAIETDGPAFDLVLYHPGYNEADRDAYIAASYILLDTALGEYDVMTGIRYIDHTVLPADPEAEGLLPFATLREHFDAHKTRHLQ